MVFSKPKKLSDMTKKDALRVLKDKENAKLVFFAWLIKKTGKRTTGVTLTVLAVMSQQKQ